MLVKIPPEPPRILQVVALTWKRGLINSNISNESSMKSKTFFMEVFMSLVKNEILEEVYFENSPIKAPTCNPRECLKAQLFYFSQTPLENSLPLRDLSSV